MKRFLIGKEYLIVRRPLWPQFVAACNEAGLKWGKRGRDTIQGQPDILTKFETIRAVVVNGKIYLAAPGTPKGIKLPTHFFVPAAPAAPERQYTREDFEHGQCYAIVRAGPEHYWPFATRMAALGFTWLLPQEPYCHINGTKPTDVMPFSPSDAKGTAIIHTAYKHIVKFTPDEKLTLPQPVIPYEDLLSPVAAPATVPAPPVKPEPIMEPDKLVVVSGNEGEVVARFMQGNTTLSRTVAKCDPRDTFRFGPGAMLAAFRGMSDADKELALSLLIHEADTTHRKKSGRIVVRIECDTSKLQSSIAETARQVHAMYAQGALGRSIRGGIN